MGRLCYLTGFAGHALPFRPVWAYNGSMEVVLCMLGAAIMGGVAYLALSKNSEFRVRIAALGALAVMIVSVIVCMVLYFRTAAVPKQLILPDMMPSEMPPPPSNSNPTMIMMIVFLVGLFVVIFFLSMREQKRKEGKEKRPSNDW